MYGMIYLIKCFVELIICKKRSKNIISPFFSFAINVGVDLACRKLNGSQQLVNRVPLYEPSPSQFHINIVPTEENATCWAHPRNFQTCVPNSSLTTNKEKGKRKGSTSYIVSAQWENAINTMISYYIRWQKDITSIIIFFMALSWVIQLFLSFKYQNLCNFLSDHLSVTTNAMHVSFRHLSKHF